MTRGPFGLSIIFFISAAATVAGYASAEDTSYLTWPAAKAQQIVRAARVNGRVGSAFGFRGLNTDRSHNYKLRATWLTDDVIRATARLTQLAERLTATQTEALVSETSKVRGTVVLIEIDPREGSGVIPLDWIATLQPQPSVEPSTPTRGVIRSDLRTVRALSGGFRRDYNYEMFWVEFPLETVDGKPLFLAGSRQAELVVRIYEKEGRVTWPISAVSGLFDRPVGDRSGPQ